MFKADVYKIMVGAPSDIKSEIQITQSVMQKWNSLHSEKQKIVLLPLHWSLNAYPTSGKQPQKTINEQVVAKSDLLICIFGTRIGTPTEDFQSGTIEEINKHLIAGKPVMIFFKQSVSDIASIDLEQLSKLQSFKKSIQGEALYWDYKDDIEFEKIISEKIQLHLNDHWIKDKIIDNGLVWDEIKSNKKVELSNFDLERLRAWTNTDNPQFFQVHFEGGGAIYGSGASNQYELKIGKDKVEWAEFFERLQKLGFIYIKKYDKSVNPVYRLKKAAYDYIASL